MSGFIEAVVKSAKELTKEVASVFKDSERPKDSNMERPSLNDTGRLSETKKFSDSERPSGRNGIEQPQLKPESAKRDVISINKDLIGKTHSETGVPFKGEKIEYKGKETEVAIPQFESHFDAKLPESMYEASRESHFKECNRQLKEAVNKDPELRSQFTKSQLEQIENGDKPKGYTWHHDFEKGKIQLVDTKIHQKTHHVGGYYLWGGKGNNDVKYLTDK